MDALHESPNLLPRADMQIESCSLVLLDGRSLGRCASRRADAAWPASPDRPALSRERLPQQGSAWQEQKRLRVGRQSAAPATNATCGTSTWRKKRNFSAWIMVEHQFLTELRSGVDAGRSGSESALNYGEVESLLLAWRWSLVLRNRARCDRRA